MQRSKICLCLTGNTIQEDLDIIETYRNYIDIVELRVDYLSSDEKLHIRKFPELAGIPCILTIRRKADGGLYNAGEAARTTLFARALAYAEQDVRKNFAYIDMENDFYLIDSHKELVTPEMLRGLTIDELNIAYNEIFARHGHDFKSLDLREYFIGCLWYRPVYGRTVSTAELSEIENQNLNIIRNEINIRKS